MLPTELAARDSQHQLRLPSQKQPACHSLATSLPQACVQIFLPASSSCDTPHLVSMPVLTQSTDRWPAG